MRGGIESHRLVRHSFLRNAKERLQMNGDENEMDHLQEDCPGIETHPGGSVESRSGSEAGRGTAAVRETAVVGMKVSGRGKQK